MPATVAPIIEVQQSIHLVRGQRVMLDADLARLYGVEVRTLNQAVKRNATRFPDDFAFRLTLAEVANLKSQSVISNRRTHGGARRSLPMAFTEQGVAMLSSVLHSERAIAVNIGIMRAFVQVRRAVAVDAEVARRLAKVEGTKEGVIGRGANAAAAGNWRRTPRRGGAEPLPGKQRSMTRASAWCSRRSAG